MPRPPVSPTKKAKRRERTSTVTEGSDPPKPSKAVRRSTKGKGKAEPVRVAQEELVQNMSKTQIEAEIKELEELKEDLALKVRSLLKSFISLPK